MGKVTIEIKTGGSAFDGDVEHEVFRILKDIINGGLRERKLMDINGNCVGSVEVEEDKEEVRTEVDGVRIYDGEIAYFNHWLSAEKYKQWDEIYSDMCDMGKDSDVIEEYHDELLDRFYEWCEDNNLRGEEV